MSEHRSPRTRLPKPRSSHNRARRPAKRPFWPERSLLREHGIELAFDFGRNINTARALNTVLAVLRTVDRRHAMRLLDAVGAFVLFATRKPKGAKRAVKP